MARFVRYEANRAIMQPTVGMMNSLEEVIQWAETEAPTKLRYYMNELVFHMALVNQGFARKMSFGPSDPGGRRTELAWRTPAQGIRRISGQYYTRWQVRQVRPAVWQLYNDSREAYYIEFGISRVGFGGTRNVPSRRIRRPVRKLSLLRTLEFCMTTRVYHRVWASIMSSPRHHGRGQGFTQIISPASDSHSIFSAWDKLPYTDVGNKSGGVNYGGPMLGRRLPG
jgi:hypothetical protein